MAEPASADMPAVVFFGSGPVAAVSLDLLAKNFQIEAVITKPKPTHHKAAFPVLETSERLGLPVFTVTDKKSLDELMATKPVHSPLGMLVDFGIIVSQQVIDYFEFGIVNSHFSILPEWRGADPINFAILSGQTQTGVSIMRLTAGLDEGPLLGYGEYEMPPGITSPALTHDLTNLSDALLARELPRLVAGVSVGSPQDITGRTMSYSRKLTKADSILDFTKPAVQLERQVRAYIDWPRSRTTIGTTDVIVTAARVTAGSGEPGALWRDGKCFGIYTADKIFEIVTLKPAGKPAMSAEAFLAGYKL